MLSQNDSTVRGVGRGCVLKCQLTKADCDNGGIRLQMH